MLEFNPALPFQPVEPGRVTRSETLTHAAACDRWLGLRVTEIEASLLRNGCRSRAPKASGEKQQIWIGLEPQDLLTPYTEIHWYLSRMRPQAGQVVVDLGAAYGRAAFVLSRHFPGVQFVGYEYVGERVQEGRRALAAFGARDFRLEHVDLTAGGFTVPAADYFFLYDFGTEKAMAKVLHDLRRLSKYKKFTLLSRGRRSRYLIERAHPWLEKAEPESPETHATLYRSRLSSGEIEAAV